MVTPPDNQCGLKQSAIGCDRKQMKKSKLIEHMKRERKSGAGNTSHEKDRETSLNLKDRSYWKTKTNGGTRHPYSVHATNQERGRESMKTACSCPTRKDQSVNIHSKFSDWFLRRGRE